MLICKLQSFLVGGMEEEQEDILECYIIAFITFSL